MNDPFAMLDPMAAKPAASAPNYATTPMNYAQTSTTNPFGASPAGGLQQQQRQQSGTMNTMQGPQMLYPALPPNGSNFGGGASFMTQQGPVPGFGGLGQQQHMATANPFMQAMPQPPQQQQQPFLTCPQPQPQQSSNPFGVSSMQPSGSMAAMQLDPFGTQMKPAASGGGFGQTPQLLRPAEPTSMPPAPLRQSSSIIVDFDPFSPRDNVPRTPFDFPVTTQSSDRTASSDFSDRKRQTQEEQRSQLGFSPGAFNTTSATGAGASKVSFKDVTDQPSTRGSGNNVASRSNGSGGRGASNSLDDSPFFTDNDDAFADHNMFANLDDEPAGKKKEWGQFAKSKTGAAAGSKDDDEIPDECGPNEYDVVFETGRKLGVLMERVDVWAKREDKRQEIAVVKLVVENGSADRVGVTTGSSVVAINARSVAKDSYAVVLDMIKAAPRPMTIRFKRGTVNKDTTQGSVLTRISSGTFSVGNLTRGNANWNDKYFAFGGAKMDVLQLFVSRAAYHECVISLYEKRPVHTQIQSFRLCRDHKITPIKSKIYKGYGNLHYFSLSVPSLRFIAAKFASEDYETLKNLWSNTYDAIERKKRMGY